MTMIDFKEEETNRRSRYRIWIRLAAVVKKREMSLHSKASWNSFGTN
jgi:hypothetical protein